MAVFALFIDVITIFLLAGVCLYYGIGVYVFVCVCVCVCVCVYVATTTCLQSGRRLFGLICDVMMMFTSIM